MPKKHQAFSSMELFASIRLLIFAVAAAFQTITTTEKGRVELVQRRKVKTSFSIAESPRSWIFLFFFFFFFLA